MLILILGLTLAGLVTFLVLRIKYPSTGNYDGFDTHDFFTFMSWVFGFTALFLVIAICCLAPTVATESVLDSKIEMYQEENANIEQDIDKIVKEYLKHEYNTYTDLSANESSITFVTLFPELRADTLVQQQLEIYVDNNAKIKSLKESKIDIARKKWILYFGK